MTLNDIDSYRSPAGVFDYLYDLLIIQNIVYLNIYLVFEEKLTAMKMILTTRAKLVAKQRQVCRFNRHRGLKEYV